MKRLMGFLVVAIALYCTFTSSSYAMQRHVFDVNTPDKQIKWENDGDIHIFDFKLRGIKITSKTDLMKANCPHSGVWIKNYAGELPDEIDARYIHIPTRGGYGYRKRRPTKEENIKENSPAAILSDANSAFDILNYQEALKNYVSFFNAYPNHRKAPYAVFMAGQALCGLNKYSESVAIHKALIQKYPNSKWVPDALFRIACVTIGFLKKQDEGKEILQTILKKYPKSSAGEDSLFVLGALDLIGDQKNQALAEWQLYLKAFPNGYYVNSIKSNISALSSTNQ
jgi:tetratricopeptide (TPR) repeat protein